MRESMKPCLALFLFVRPVHVQTASSATLSDRALQEFREGKYHDAERDFREITEADPSNIFGQVYLGQTLFKEEKYPAAAGPYEKARALEKNGGSLSQDQHRVLIDQLV